MERSNAQPIDHESPAAASEPALASARKRKSGPKLTEWQSFFLDRLDYQLAAQREQRASGEDQATLLSKAVYSTYLDCQAQGVGDEALQRITASSGATPSAN
jgi:hypothetical protein